MDYPDETWAMALKLADDKLRSIGWKYSAEDVGTTAAKIIIAFNKEFDKVEKENKS